MAILTPLSLVHLSVFLHPRSMLLEGLMSKAGLNFGSCRAKKMMGAGVLDALFSSPNSFPRACQSVHSGGGCLVREVEDVPSSMK